MINQRTKTNVLIVSVVTGFLLCSSPSLWAWGIGDIVNKAKKVKNNVVDKAKEDIDKVNGDTNQEEPTVTTEKTPDTYQAKPAVKTEKKTETTTKKSSSSSVRQAKSGKGGDRRAFIERRKKEREARKNNYKICNKGKIDTEPMPANKYTGKDKADLEATIKAAWQKKYPKDEILAIRFHSDKWIRNTKAKSNSTSIYVNDTSVLPLKVIVKTNDKVATIFPAYINKDHQKNNAIRPGVATKTNSHVIKQMLISNIK